MITLNKKQLQLLAIAAMVCDHFAWGFLDFFSVEGQILHWIGRLTLPIMCFFIAEGFRHTSNHGRYLTRLFCFAVITMVPFYLFFHEMYGFRQNIIFDLGLGLLVLEILEHSNYSKIQKIFGVGIMVCISLCIGGWVLMPMIYILIFYYGKDFKTQAKLFCIATVTMVAILTVTIWLNQIYHFMHYSWVWYDKFYLLGFMLALIPLSRYNHEKGNFKNMSLFFYTFYPVHFFVLYIIKQIVLQNSFQELYVAFHVMTMLCTILLITVTAMAAPSRPQVSCLIAEIFMLFYCVGYWIEINTTNIDVCRLAVKIQYFGEVFLLVGLTWFIAEFCQFRLSKIVYATEYVISFVILCVVGTMEKHSLFYRSFAIDYSGSFPRLVLEYGPVFYLFMLYMAGLCILFFYQCIKKLAVSKGLVRKRIQFLIIGICCPWIATLIRYLGFSDGYELSSFGGFFAIVFLAIALIQYGYFNSVHLAAANALNHGTSGIMVYDLQGNIQYFNKIMKQILPAVTINGKVGELKILEKALSGEDKKVSLAEQDYEVTVEPLMEKGYEQGYMLWAINMTQYYQQLERANRLAGTDDLTGLYSRNYFQMKVMETLYKGESGSFFILDLDNFKKVNDHMGHQNGDRILILLAKIINRVANEHFTCRIGGDEFCIFWKDVMDPEILSGKAEQIIQEFYEEINNFIDPALHVSVSIGIAQYNSRKQQADDTEEIYQLLYRYADRALYIAKGEGKGTYRFYRSNVNASQLL